MVLEDEKFAGEGRDRKGWRFGGVCGGRIVGVVVGEG